MIAKLRAFRSVPHPVLVRALTLVVTYALLLVMLSTAATPMQYDIGVGEVAPLTITATKDVEDTAATQKLIDAAVAAVSPSYVADDNAAELVDTDLQLVSVKLDTIRSEAEGRLTASLLTRFRNLLGKDISVEESELLAVIEADEDTYTLLLSRTRRLVKEELNANVIEGQEKDAADRVRRTLLNEGFDPTLASLMQKLVRQYMRPSMVLDEEATEANRQKAAEAVEPVIYKQGQNIVRSGEVITAAQYDMLKNLGLLMDDRIDFALYAGLALSLAIVLSAMVLYLFAFEKVIIAAPLNLVLICGILVLVSAICLLTRYISPYLMPVSLAAILVGVLLKPRIGLIVGLGMSIVCILYAVNAPEGATFQFYVLLLGVLSACACNGLQKKRNHRLVTLLCGLVSAGCGFVAALPALLLNNANLSKAAPVLLYSAGSGILSGMLCLGFQPALEWIFNLLTPTKLLELSNPNHPLLRRLLLEAPGTYHHSIIVANLAEAAAEAIGANALLARVGAYYHDVGKLKRPLYFKENQLGDNPHDRTDPAVSSAILTVHPRDGVAMAKKFRIPKPILDIIEQHHGDTPTLYFYDRAVKQNPNVTVRLDDFRYAGPKPQSCEAAIVMLADTVEAATRAAGGTDSAKTEQLLRKLIRAKMDDGQLAESPLTMKDLENVSVAFLTVLTGVFHERVEYPNVETGARALERKEEKHAD